MTKIIGLTGGIGSGKTTAARFFQEQGIPVYFADDAAKEIMQQESVIEEVQTLFKETIKLPDGQLNRKLISQLVFVDPTKLEALNAIIHPKVHAHFAAWLEKHSTTPFIIKEVAILFEKKGHLQCDATILIKASLENRISRVMKRDNKSKDEVLQIIQNQLPELEKEKLATYVISNDNLDKMHEALEILVQNLKNRYKLT